MVTQDKLVQCTNIMKEVISDLHSVRNLIESGSEVRAYRKVQGTLTKCDVLYDTLLKARETTEEQLHE
jgi:hypothetical protein